MRRLKVRIRPLETVEVEGRRFTEVRLAKDAPVSFLVFRGAVVTAAVAQRIRDSLKGHVPDGTPLIVLEDGQELEVFEEET